MFKTLQLKLAIFNLIILIAFLCIFSGFIYLQSSHTMMSASTKDMKRIIMQIENSGMLPPFMFENKKLPVFESRQYNIKEFVGIENRQKDTFIIIRDMSSNVAITNISDDKLSELTEKLSKKLSSKNPSFVSEISADGKTYRVCTTFFTFRNKPGIIQVVDNITMEKDMLAKLMYTLLLFGFASSLVLFGISWLLAKKAIKPIKASWEKERRFIADASHELKTPLTIIRANLDIPINEMDPDNSEHYLWIKNAYDETENMQHIVNELLELVKIDSGYQNISKASCDLSEIANQAANQFQPLMEEKKLEIIKTIEENAIVCGNKEKLRQLIVILLDNAFQYTSFGHIEVSVKKDGHSAVLSVSDTGVGIASEDLPYIFDRFYRADAARIRKERNLGLGLSIAKGIVDMHHGKIEVSSMIEKGTTFKVILPLI